MPTAIHRRVREARAGTNPQVIAKLPSGWVLLGDTQLWPGYCVLLPDPVVADLDLLEEPDRARFLTDLGRLGVVVKRVTGARRINYEMLGNLEPALHAHVFPRFAHEPEAKRPLPVWLYSPAERDAVPFDLARDRPLMDRIAAELAREA